MICYDVIGIAWCHRVLEVTVDDDVKLIRVDEAARALRIGRTRMYELLAKGELPSIRIGHSVRVPIRALAEWISQHSRKGADVEGAAA